MVRLQVLIFVCLSMYLVAVVLPDAYIMMDAASTLSFGFLVLAAYLFAELLARMKLPRLTGYIAAGMLFGPSALGFLTPGVIGDLKLVDDLALTFIAFAAGGELHLDMLRRRKRIISLTLICQVVFVLIGVTAAMFLLRSLFPLTASMSMIQALGVAAICGAIAVARSPSSAIAIISETRAKGPFTEMILGVTVAADVLTIFLFAVVLSFSDLAISGQPVDFTFLLAMCGEVVISLAVGLLLGAGISLYLAKVGTELTIFILGIAFLITQFSYGMTSVLHDTFAIDFHLKPMLICMTAGFYLRNFSRNGDEFIQIIDRSSLPIYTIFFAMSGAALKIEALQDTWLWVLILVGMRTVFVYLGSLAGGKLGGDSRVLRRVSGLGFLTQAGVSLGLIKMVSDRFPGFGDELATLLVAAVAMNQIIGPVGLKYALSRAGETRESRACSPQA